MFCTGWYVTFLEGLLNQSDLGGGELGLTLRLLLRAEQHSKLLPKVDLGFSFQCTRADTVHFFRGPKMDR